MSLKYTPLFTISRNALQKLADDSTVFPEDIARMYSRLE